MPIEQHAPELERIVSVDQEILELAAGFGGDAGPAEGPLWWEEEVAAAVEKLRAEKEAEKAAEAT